jgi:phenylalanyl-tRNA synthetase beta chain
LHPDVAEAYELVGPVVVVTLDLQALARTEVLTRTYVPIPRFPASSRDLAVVVREGLAAGEVLRVLGERAGALAESVELFDRYAGKGVPEGHVSLGFRIVYRKADGTLTDAEVDGLHGRVVEEVTSRFGATVRA